MNKHLYAYIPMVLLLTWIVFQIGEKIADRYPDTVLQQESLSILEWEGFCVQDTEGNVIANSPDIICDAGNAYTLVITGKVLEMVTP